MSYKREPTMCSMCPTCPFRKGSPHAALAPLLSKSALTEASRICHSTGGPNAIHPGGTGKPARLCRGARDVQLAAFHAFGVIAEPTDAAWEAACKERGL